MGYRQDQTGGPHRFEQVFRDRLAGDADLADAAVYRADRQRHAHPRQEKLAGFWDGAAATGAAAVGLFAWLAQADPPPAPPIPKGGSEDGGRELLDEFIAKRPACSIAIR